MELDDELCLCFHVSKRKVISFLRIERPARVGQLSECFSAGTGCGWCRSYLARLFEQANSGAPAEANELDKSDYARQRARYIRSGGGVPPSGATPLEPPDRDDED